MSVDGFKQNSVQVWNTQRGKDYRGCTLFLQWTTECASLEFRGLNAVGVCALGLDGVFWIASARVFDLHIFHADPLVIGENGPHRHCVDTLLFLWGGEKMEGNLTTEISWLFHYTVCAACIVTPI